MRYKHKLDIHISNSSVITDHTRNGMDCTRDPFTLDMSASDDYLYIGSDVAIDSLFIEMGSNKNVDSELEVRYFNGTTEVEVENKLEDTRGLSRSGFIDWDTPIDQMKSTHNGESKYWIRLALISDFNAEIEINGINILLCDINDCSNIEPIVSDIDFVSLEDRIKILMGARDEIVEALYPLTPWDIKETPFVKKAAKYYALHRMYFINSNNDEDIESVRSTHYLEQYEIALGKIEVDRDSDGVIDANDKADKDIPTYCWSR